MDQSTEPSNVLKVEQVSDPSIAPSSVSNTQTSPDARGLEMETMKDGGASVAAVSTGEILSQKLPGVTKHSPTIKNVDEAIAYIRRKANADAKIDDHTAITRKSFEWWRKCIYNAMITLPEGTSEWQQLQWKRFNNMISSKKYSFADIEAKSWIVAEEVIKLHERGSQDDWSKSNEDKSLTCWTRMDAVARTLLYNKSACQDVMNNEVKMLHLIGAPHGVMESKLREKEGKVNKQREKQRLLAQREDSVSTITTSEMNEILQITMDAQDEAMEDERGSRDASEQQTPTASLQCSPSRSGQESKRHTGE